MIQTIIGLVLLALWVLIPTGLIVYKVCLGDDDNALTESVKAYHD